MQKETFQELPLSDSKQRLLGNKAAVNFFFRAVTPRGETLRKPVANPFSGGGVRPEGDRGPLIAVSANSS